MFDVIAEVRRDYIVDLLKAGKRVDGRGLDDYREITIEKGVSEKAEGSSLVKIGNTQVMTGIKLILGEPFSDMPDSGVLTTNAELRPLASPTFEKGPPGEDTIEVARVVDRGIRESNAIDLDKLCIVPGEKVWIVFIDMHVLDHDGNLFDAGTLGAISALLDARIPKIEDDRVIYDERKEPLPVLNKPIETTYAKIGDSIVLDPSLDEELVMDARLTVATDQKGNICAMQKGGGKGTFTQEEILDIVKRSKEKAKELRKLL
jgi:exosome complex component RRP42